MSTLMPIRTAEEMKEKHKLGSLQLRHADSNQIILIPTPTNDPNGEYHTSKDFATLPETYAKIHRLHQTRSTGQGRTDGTSPS